MDRKLQSFMVLQLKNTNLIKNAISIDDISVNKILILKFVFFGKKGFFNILLFTKIMKKLSYYV